MRLRTPDQSTDTSEAGQTPVLRAVEILLMTGLAVTTIWVAAMVIGPSGFGWSRSDPGMPVVRDAFRVMSVPVTLDTDVVVEGAPEWSETATGTVDARTGGRPVELGGPYTAQLSFWEPSTGERLTWLGARVIGPVVTGVCLVLLLMLVRSVRRGDPFTPRNARLVTALGGTVMIGGTVAGLAHETARVMLVEGSAARDITLMEWEFSFVPLLVGLFIAVLGEVWRSGVRMRDDLEGVV